MEMKDLLDSVVSMGAGAPLCSAPTVGDVLEICRHKVELVQMPLPKPRVSWRHIKDKGKTMNVKKNDGIAVNNSSLMHLEDWDPVDNSIFLAKLQHKLQ